MSRPTPPARLPRALALAASLLIAVPLFGGAPELAHSSSAFLRAHADSKIDWQPWNEATFARAKKEQKPIYLAIGIFTSELSRAMARQSFANADVAAMLNQNFICVLVDAKEQPDLTALCQAYLRTTKQLNGLPINLWLTPELKPIDGSTYIPPTEEWGKEGFFAAIKRISAAWKADPAGQRRKADDAVASVVAAERLPTPAVTPADIASTVAAATDGVRSRFDTAHGGFGDPPKYPEPELLQYLLKDAATRELALTTLRAMIASPMRDPLDGGFFRYAQDPEWKQPYFQKNLVDQARLALTLLEAAKLTGYTAFADAARGALDYSLTRLHDPAHGFANAEDATPEQLAGTYFWTKSEIAAVLGDDAPAFCAAYGVTDAGNVPADAYSGLTTAGKNLLCRVTPAGKAADEKKLAADCAKLLAKRASRPAPRRDDYATAAAHGLMLSALVRAGNQPYDPRFRAAAKAEFAFIRDHLCLPDGGLRRLADQPFAAAPIDYVLTIQGLWDIQAAGEKDAGPLAEALTKTLQARFWDEAQGRYFAVADPSAPGFWARPHLPPPTGGDVPLADAAMLASNTSHLLPAGLVAKLVPAVVEQLKEAGDDRRGDLLLALQSAPK